MQESNMGLDEYFEQNVVAEVPQRLRGEVQVKWLAWVQHQRVPITTHPSEYRRVVLHQAHEAVRRYVDNRLRHDQEERRRREAEAVALPEAGRLILQIMKQRRLGTSSLAEQLGVPEATLRKAISGQTWKRRCPTAILSTLRALARD
jgi:hypothetical protein